MLIFSFRKIKQIYFFVILSLLTQSCRKLVDVSPPITSVTGSSVYSSDANAISVLTGLYSQISSSNPLTFGSPPSLSVFTGLSADDLTLWSGATSIAPISYYKNQLSGASNGNGYEFWYNAYPSIFICNSSIEGLTNPTILTPIVKDQLLGEAKFMRAFYYFFLTNLYGDVPIVLGSDYKLNSQLKRSSQAQVYQQIISDLKDAQQSLSSDYLDATILNTTEEKVRPTKSVARALLARVYLYTSNWAAAETNSTILLDSSSFSLLPDLHEVFLKNSAEAIWQLQPVNLGHNTEDARLFIIPNTGPSNSHPIYLSNSLINSFELNDARKSNWTKSLSVGTNTYVFPYKYKINAQNAPVSEYLTMFRLAEQYLIRSEARAQQGNITGALSDLNTIRIRAALPITNATTKADILTSIYHEYRVEFFTEFANRWFTLKRTGIIDQVMAQSSIQKNSNWVTTQQLYPIPFSELQKDINLTQNIGY